MTSANMSWRNETGTFSWSQREKRLPFLLTPAPKHSLWGGTRLRDDFGKPFPEPLAETWECSSHPDGESTVDGTPLSAVLRARPDFLGSHPLQTMGGKPELPILIKLIDAREKLSVQVHPDDAYAWTRERSLGKTEMWYVLEAKKGSELVYGFRREMTREQVRGAVAEGTIERYLNHVPVRKNDVFFIEAGTVHAIGAGVLIAEIQENSNLTYRLYDYGRLDRTGKPRPLHLAQALETARLTRSEPPAQPMRVLRYQRGIASELLNRCKYFQVERLLLNTETHRGMADFRTGSNSFHALLCMKGCGVLFGRDFMLNFFKGDCVFVPAQSIPLKLHGRAQLLNVSC